MDPRSFQKKIKKNLQDKVLQNEPILVGLSGGIDSIALFHALVACEYSCIAVHVDHGWRKESSQEAEFVVNFAASFGVRCYVYRLPSMPQGSNAEDWSRAERYRCFERAAVETGFSYLAVAHHAKDQGETVIKRFLEGSTISALRGMKQVDTRNSLTIIRPLLWMDKQEIIRYVHTIGLPYVEDPSNADLRYLRPRLRHEIFPFLEEKFGKKILGSIVRVSQYAAEIDEYLAAQVAALSFEKTVFGLMVSPLAGQIFHAAVLRKFFRMVGEGGMSFEATTALIAQACSHSGEVIQVSFAKKTIYAQGQVLLVSEKRLQTEGKPVLCVGPSGTVVWGNWKITWEEGFGQMQEGDLYKKLLSEGRVCWQIPLGDFLIGAITHHVYAKNSKKQKIPSLLRPYIPALFRGLTLVVDPISGYTGQEFLFQKRCTIVTIVGLL